HQQRLRQLEAHRLSVSVSPNARQPLVSGRLPCEGARGRHLAWSGGMRHGERIELTMSLEGIRVAAPPGEEGQDMLTGALAAGAGAPVPDRPARELDRDAVRRATAALPPAGEPRSSV